MNQDEKSNVEELYAVVRGRVQGVGFRYFVVRQALALSLHGYVRNSGSSVEVVAQGTHTALEGLLAQLWHGPSAADVQGIQTIWRTPGEHISGFHVRY